MKDKKILFVIFIVITTILLSGCSEENQSNQNNKTETVSLKDLGLRTEDLPTGYSQYYIGDSYLSEFSNQSSDSLLKWFINRSATNLTYFGVISCELNKFNSTNKASQIFNDTIDFLISDRNFSIIKGSINRIGNESKSLEKEGFTDLLAFRISDIIVVMSSPNYPLTFDLGKIVEQRIKNSYS